MPKSKVRPKAKAKKKFMARKWEQGYKELRSMRSRVAGLYEEQRPR